MQHFMENLYKYDRFTMSEIHSEKCRNNCFTCLVKLNRRSDNYFFTERIIQKAVPFLKTNCITATYIYIFLEQQLRNLHFPNSFIYLCWILSLLFHTFLWCSLVAMFNKQTVKKTDKCTTSDLRRPFLWPFLLNKSWKICFLNLIFLQSY